MRKKWQLEKVVAGREYDPITPDEDDGSDPAYLKWLRKQPCAVFSHPFDGCGPCGGVVEAHHHTKERGRGQKAPDREAFPLCMVHHHAFHAARGGFLEWKKPKRRKWQDRMVREHLDRAPL